MQTLEKLPFLIDQGTPIVAIESPTTERMSILKQLHGWTQERSLPLFFWNSGYASFQQVQFTTETNRLLSTDLIPGADVLQFLLE